MNRIQMSGEIALSEESVGAELASVGSFVGMHFERVKVQHALFGKCLRTLVHVTSVLSVVIMPHGDVEGEVARGAEGSRAELAAKGVLV